MGSDISLKTLTAEEIADKVASLGPNYVPYRVKILSDGLAGDILDSFIRSEEQINILFNDLEIMSMIHRARIRKSLIEPFVSSNEIKASTSRLKLMEAVEQDQIIAHNIENNKYYYSFNTLYEKIKVPYCKRRNVTSWKLKKIQFINEITIRKIKYKSHDQFITSVSFFPCREPTLFNLSDDEIDKLEKAWSEEIKIQKELKNLCELNFMSSIEDSSPLFTSDEQNLLLDEWIRASKKQFFSLAIKSDEKLCICIRCKFNCNPDNYYLKINRMVYPIRYSLIRSSKYLPKTSKTTPNNVVEEVFIIENLIDLRTPINQAKQSKIDYKEIFLRQLGKKKKLMIGYYSTEKSMPKVLDLMKASDIDIRKNRKHLSWWIGSIIPNFQDKFQRNFSFVKKCSIQNPCRGHCQCNFPLLQACYYDRYGDSNPKLSLWKREKRRSYKYSRGECLIDKTIILKEKETNELSINKKEKNLKQIEIVKSNTLNWPSNISQYEKYFQYNQAKFNYLVERMNETGTITIFLSSPFDGCAVERSELMKRFRTLTAKCLKHGIHLLIIDFRTGITDQLVREKKTILTCLRAIDKANIFIGYFGARYGSSLLIQDQKTAWIHQAVDTCLLTYPFLETYRNRSVTEMEWQHAFLHNKNYMLENKPISFFLYRSADYDIAQESVITDTIEKSKSFYHIEEECKEASLELKRNIIDVIKHSAAYGSLIDNYENPVIGAEIMYACCETLIVELLKKVEIQSFSSPVYRTHFIFVKSRLNIYLDLAPTVALVLKEYIEDADLDNNSLRSHPFLITGLSGSGKTSFMANLVNELLSEKIGFKDQYVFFHFCGCDNASQVLPDILRRLYTEFCNFVNGLKLCNYVEKNIDSINDIIPEISEIYECFEDCLPPLIILIDAIDQLEDKRYDYSEFYPSSMTWLPDSFHKRIKMIFTCIPGEILNASIKADKFLENNIAVVKGLDENNRKGLVLSWYSKFYKSVDERFLSRLWTSSQCENVMYLSILLNDMITNATYSSLQDGTYLDNLLSSNSVPTLLSKIICAIEIETRIAGERRPDIFSSILCYIYCSREGLSIDELQNLTNCWDATFWSALQYDLHQILALRHGLFNFTHKYMFEAVERCYIYHDNTLEGLKVSLNESSQQLIKVGQTFLKQKHIELAVMFKNIVDTSSDEENPRPLREQEYHERMAGYRPSVMVVVRSRPPNDKEIDRNETLVVEMKSNIISLNHPKRIGYSCSANFALSKDVPQRKVFQICGEDVISQVLNGNNVSVIAYGQTSSGKTYTMFGHKYNSNEKGLIPRIMENLIYEMESDRKREGLEWIASCTAVEIYKDEVYDLLRSNESKRKGEEYQKHVVQLQFSSLKNGGNAHDDLVMKTVPFEVSFKNISNAGKLSNSSAENSKKKELEGRKIKKPEDIDIIMLEANKNRIMKSTSLNDQSSRSHCILTLYVKRQNKRTKVSVSSKVHLVDLAGSERLSRIGKDSNGRERLNIIDPILVEESIATNKSLSVLNKCILALSDNKVSHIPYRESTLTTVLQDSLGGSSKLILIGTISPSESDYDETLSTLKYASIAKNIAIGKNRISELATAEQIKKDDENARKCLIDQLGFSEYHLDLYKEYFSSHKDNIWINNLSNDITWTKEYKRWKTRLESFLSKILENIQWKSTCSNEGTRSWLSTINIVKANFSNSIQWISMFKANCTDASYQRYLRVLPGENFDVDLTYTYLDNIEYETEFQLMIDCFSIQTISKIGNNIELPTRSEVVLSLSAPPNNGLYMIWTRSIKTKNHQNLNNYSDCEYWYPNFVAWLRVDNITDPKICCTPAIYMDPELESKLVSDVIEEAVLIQNRSVYDLDTRGVSIKVFKAIRTEALRRNPDSTYWSMGRITATLIGNHEILKEGNRWGHVDKNETLTYIGQCSLIDLMEKKYSEKYHPLLNFIYDDTVFDKATVFINFAYSDNFIELVDALESYLEKNKSTDTCFFWFDMFVNDQWNALDRDFDWWASTFGNAVESIGEIVIFASPWNDPNVLKRVWCVFELVFARKISLAISKTQRESLKKKILTDSDSVLESLSHIDLEKADSYLPEDKEKIFAVVRHKGGFHKLNVTIVGLLRDWINDVISDMTNTSLKSNKNVNLSDLEALVKSANLFEKQGNYNVAESLLERALTGYEELLGPDHHLTLSVIDGLAHLYFLLGKLDKSIRFYERSSSGFERLFGPNSEQHLKSLQNIANIFSSEGNYDKALVNYNKALIGCEKLLGPDHLSVLTICYDIANLFLLQGNYAEARSMCERSLIGKEKILGPDHYSTLKTYNILGKILEEQGNFDESKLLQQRALSGCEKILGLRNPTTLQIQNDLANLLMKKCDFREAEYFYNKVSIGFSEIYGSQHPEALNSFLSLANSLMKQGKLEEALLIYEDVYKVYENSLGSNHLNTQGIAKIIKDLREGGVN